MAERMMTAGYGPNTKEEKQWVAIRNRMEFYAAKSLHYKVDGPYEIKISLIKT